ncbi:MAG TPA: hypothetical protein EYM31_02375 [Acidobacteria bacterium]|nr:hypothetical protein [Acidobacteriota bacterium]
MTAADRQRLLDRLKQERRKGLEAWHRLCQDMKPFKVNASALPTGQAIRSTHPCRATNNGRLQRD